MQGILEGLLYVQGDEGLTINDVINILNITEDEAKDLIANLKKEYEQENRGLRINFLGNTFKLTTKEEHKEYYQKLLENPKTNTLSQAALETLAIIAYNEPITRVQIDELRGTESAHLVRKLLAKGLIKEAGKSELPGKPILYKTTDEFLDYFGLSTIADLPNINDVVVEDDKEKDLFKSNYHDNDEIIEEREN
jgi:segregation and condensation protein B